MWLSREVLFYLPLVDQGMEAGLNRQYVLFRMTLFKSMCTKNLGVSEKRYLIYS